MTILYLIIKLLYVINAITQFVLLNKILGVDFLSYGVDALFLAVQGEDISLSNRYVFRCISTIEHYLIVISCSLVNYKDYCMPVARSGLGVDP